MSILLEDLPQEIQDNLEDYVYVPKIKLVNRKARTGKRYIINDEHYFLIVCKYCDCRFLVKRDNATSCDNCKFKGDRNGRFADHRSFEDLHGKEKAEKLKAVKRELWLGENNCNFGDKHWINNASEEKILEYKKKQSIANKGKMPPHTNMSYEEYYGEKRAKEIKKKLSISGINREIPPSEKCSYGYSGRLNGIFFRSLFELSFLLECKEKSVKVKSAENKEFMVKYVAADGIERRHFPDFYLIDEDCVVEIKPTFKLKILNEKLKIRAAHKYFKNYKLRTTNSINVININKLKDLYERGEVQLSKGTLRRVFKNG